jgi:hypothetical protein
VLALEDLRDAVRNFLAFADLPRLSPDVARDVMSRCKADVNAALDIADAVLDKAVADAEAAADEAAETKE